jgi:hypothetical protein
VGFLVTVALGWAAVSAVVFTTLIDEPKPAAAVRWYKVPGSHETIHGDRFDLVCDQTVNREALAGPREVPLQVGDRVRTVCVAVLRTKRAA